MAMYPGHVEPAGETDMSSWERMPFRKRPTGQDISEVRKGDKEVGSVPGIFSVLPETVS
jgi:hypothetical protein